MRAVDMIDILHLPDYTTAAISSAISFLTKGWVEVQSGEAAGLTSLLEVLQLLHGVPHLEGLHHLREGRLRQRGRRHL